MKLYKEYGQIYLEGTGKQNWFVHTIEDYSQFISACNWYTFRLALIELENDEIMGGFEFTCIIVGIGIRFRWNHSNTEASVNIANKIAELKDKYNVE